MSEDRSGGIQYLDFEVEITGSQGRYHVGVLRSEGGEARGQFASPCEPGETRNLWTNVQLAIYQSRGGVRRVLSPEEDRVRELGGQLMESLLSGGVRSCWDLTRARASQQQKRVRVKLRVQAPELAALPWELLYDRRQGDYLSLMRNVSIVRYAEQAEGSVGSFVNTPLRVLGLVAAPSDLEGLDVERERNNMENALKRLQDERLLELVWVPGQTWRDLQNAMNQGPWHILHFIGHGYFDAIRDEGAVALVADNGRIDGVHATDLGRLLSGHPPLRLVVLNACEGARESETDLSSSCAATLVRRGIPAVLAMQYEIGDEAAVEFSRTFYTRIGQGLPIEAAVSEARIAMSLSHRGSLEWAAPVLHLRTQDGRLFEVSSQAQRQAEEQAQRQAEEQAQRQAEEQAQRQAEEQAQRQAEEQAQRQAEEQAQRQAEEQAQRQAEEQARQQGQEQAEQRQAWTKWALNESGGNAQLAAIAVEAALKALATGAEARSAADAARRALPPGVRTALPQHTQGLGRSATLPKAANTHDATVALILGLLSVFLCALLGPVAIWYGRKVRRRIAVTDGPRAGAAIAGIWLGVVGTFLLGFGIISVLVSLFSALSSTS